MLDTDTKRRIDTARDILVGKVPDPKSQVEQITIALIYKFMDDMDAESEEFGGQRKFFAGEFARYSWVKLMRSGLGGHETLNLYAEAISKMPESSGIPPLFREIFKNAYLPYRDPETLRAFLKIIDEFEYDHSERLGDAFEYLLSVLGSQGDAGQFRTPRHIIDFIVEIIDPKKNEIILDPACGTAGFLISSYKHILRANTDTNGNSTLTPDDKGRLAKNFKGYDISPDMVRLSLVNLYLHGFTDPHIDEYDTLTSEDKWNEFADVILANPPFMSPKGGIKPHKRFSVQSKRSEVLFVDYMAEHLTPNGRAGIIVPEGIIFQNQTAYKQLRKMLVEKHLVAVVSLPAGVFNPYSGVKTSILILDNSLAKKSSTIAFFKIDNEGFGLGSQRRPIEKNDLPQVAAEFAEYLGRLRARESVEELQPTLGLIVAKENIAASGDYNLTGERYREEAIVSATFPFVAIGAVCETTSGGTPLKSHSDFYKGGTIPWLRSGEVSQGEIFSSELFITEAGLENSAAKIFPPNTVLVAMYGATAGQVGILRFATSTNQAICGITPSKVLLPDFLFWILKGNKETLVRLSGGGAQPNISQKIIREIQIPLPPLDVQKEIVEEIENYQKVIVGAHAVLAHYRPHIPIHPDWPMIELGEVFRLSSGRALTKAQMTDGLYPVYGGNGKNGLHSEYFVEDPIIVIGRVGAYCGVVHITEPKAWVTDNGLYVTEYRREIDQRFLAQMLAQLDLNQYANVGGQPSISQKTVYERKVPLPSFSVQQTIASEIEAERALVDANRELTTRNERKIQATLARVWGEDEPTQREA